MNKVIGVPHMIMEKIINIAYHTFFKIPAHRNEKFTYMQTDCSLSCLSAFAFPSAGILIKVQQVIMITYTMNMMGSPMSLMTLYTYFCQAQAQTQAQTQTKTQTQAHSGSLRLTQAHSGSYSVTVTVTQSLG